MSISFASLKHLNLPTSIKIPVTLAKCLYLHDSYTTKYDFMNYASCMVVTHSWSELKKNHSWARFFFREQLNVE